MSIAITGMGIISPIGIGQAAFVEGLKAGQTNFSIVALVMINTSVRAWILMRLAKVVHKQP